MNAKTRTLRILKGLALPGGITISYALAGFYGLPYLAKTQVPALIREATGREAAISTVELNPFTFRFAIQGFAIREKDGRPFAGFDRFAADLELGQSLRNAAVTLADVELLKPSVRLARDQNGRFNFEDLKKSEKESPPETSHQPFALLITRIALSGGHLIWEDGRAGTTSFSETIEPIDLSVENFTLQKDRLFPLHLKLSLKSGGSLDWQGEAGIDPVFSKGKLAIGQFKLDRLSAAGLLPAGMRLQGSETLEAEYRFDHSLEKGVNLEIPHIRFELRDFAFEAPKDQNLAVQSSAVTIDTALKIESLNSKWQVSTDQAEIKLNGLAVNGMGPVAAALAIPEAALSAACTLGNQDRGFNLKLNNGKAAITGSTFLPIGEQKPWIKIGSFSGEGIGLDLQKRTVSADSLKSENAEVQLRLNKEGRLNYQDLVSKESGNGSTGKTDAQADASASPPWTVALKSFALKNYGVTFEDNSQSSPVTLQLNPIELTVRDFTTQNGAKLPVQLSAGFNREGRIKADGTLVVQPLEARLNVAIRDIGLDKFQPYVDRFTRLDIIDGGFFADGKLDFRQHEEKPDIKFAGLAGVADLITRDQIQNKDFIKWEKLTLSEIDADVLANRYTAKRLLIEKPYARIVIRKDKTVNINEVLSTGHSSAVSASASKAAKKPAEDSASPYLKLDKIQVRDGSSDFADLSLILPFAAEIKELNGGADGFSSDKKAKVKIGLKGNAYDLAPVDVRGEVSPYRGDYDVGLSFHGLPMPLVSPYMVQFAGYKVEKGKLNLDLKYKVENGALSAANNILIDQFELGEKVENPNAVSLPLELAVALLKDGDNRIKLDVPISGSLEDPKFSVRAIVTDALLNALNKVISSPFKAIGSLFDGGENLDHIHFKPGKSDLDKEQAAKLDDLSKALKERPALNLDIKGAAYEEQDWPALKDAALYDQLRRLKAAAIGKKTGKKVRAEYVELDDDEYKDYLAQMFIEKFPLLAERNLFGKPKLINEKEGEFYEVAKQKLFTIIKPEEQRLKDLAAKRAQAIAKYIVQQGGILPERVFILDTAINPEREGQDIVSRLSLKAR